MDSNNQPQVWAARVKKWRYRIDTTTATDEDILEYIKTKLYDYMSDRVSDVNLWDLFQEDFKDFTPEIFTNNRREVQRLRTCLHYGSVFVVSNTKSITIAQTLMDVVNEEEQHK